jgi:YNFM family putative membrane transporter
MESQQGSETVSGKIVRGTPAYRRTSLAIFSCGFSIFAILYCTQPILPQLTQEFGVTPAQSSLALSLTTITMAVAMLFASSLSEAVGRKPMMLGALITSSILTLALSLAQEWNHILWLRALAGVGLSGMPAVALAYLGEEMDKGSVAPAVGLYIGGGAVGGMSGRLVTSFLADYGSWRLAMIGLGLMGLVSALIFWRALEPSRFFVARKVSFIAMTKSMLGHFRNPGIVLLAIAGFVMLGGYMALFNYIGFRLQGAPFNWSQTAAGLVFIVYPIGSLGSANMGALAARYGRGRMLMATLAISLVGLAVMTPDNFLAIAIGLMIMTYGFFGAHSICSGWAPALAARDKAQASSLYLLLYYIGGGVAGSMGGIFWQAYGWNGVAAFAALLYVLTLGIAFAMTRFANTQ